MKRQHQDDDFIHFLFELEKRKTIQPKCPPSGCRCECCTQFVEKVPADIRLNTDLMDMQRMFAEEQPEITRLSSGLVQFIDMLKSEPSTVPNFAMLDTVTFSNGRPKTLIYYQEKLRIELEPTLPQLKSFLLLRKLTSDVDYLKQNYKEEHPSFIFILLDHESEKLLKSFERKLKSIHPSQRKICSVQWKARDHSDVLNQLEFEQLFEGKKISGGMSLIDVEYMQLFPTIFGEQEQERTDRVYYFRNRYMSHPHYRTAEQFYSVWGGRNQTLQELEERFINTLKHPQEYLEYVTCKLAVHVQYCCDHRLQSFMAEYTRDHHGNIRLKNIRYLRSTKKVGLYLKQNLFSSQRTIPESEHIELKSQMTEQFRQFQQKFKAVYSNELDHMTLQIIDTQRSQHTFQQLTRSTADLQDLLRSRNSPVKKKKLGLH